ncbi:PPC domain-containing protein [Pseudomonas sp. CGJS7]|uniref:PPC domain-containing protein n=1 Tax=Pseudomonas sp. CGJS7 TaxID=3109348 RepID=UPI003008B97D
MRMEIRGARRWMAGWAVALALVNGSATAAALTAPYVLQGLQPGGESIRYAAGADGGLMALAGRPDLQTGTVSRFDRNGQLLFSHSMAADWNDIASDRLGNYVTANVTSQGVFAAVFNRNGTAIVPRFQVSARAQTQTLQVAMNESGMFVVVYNTSAVQPSAPTIHSTYARVFNRDGSARTSEFLIATGNPETHVHSWALAIDGAGTFTVSLLRVPPGRGEQRIVRYNRDGVYQGGIDDPTGRAINGEMVGESANLAANSAGQHVFGWGGIIVSTRISSARMQRFDATGGWLGSQVLLGRDPDGSRALAHSEAKVAIAGDGRTLAVWSRRSSYSDLYAQWNVYGREFRADGTPLGDEFRIDTAPASALLYPDTLDVLMTADGQYTVTWAETDGGQQRRLARRYRMEGGPAVQTLSSGVPIGGLSGAINSFQYFRFTVPPNTPSFTLTLSGAGDADMFVKYGEPPNLYSYDIATGIAGSNEGALVNNPPAGDFYVGVFGYSAYSGVSLQADW